MKLHLPKTLFTAVMALFAISPAAYALTVDIDRTYTYDSFATDGTATVLPDGVTYDATTGELTGMDSKNIFISDIGKILELSPKGAKFVGTVPSGKVLVDGLGVGDVGNIVLRDRKHLAEDGIIIVVLTIDKTSCECVAGPDIISRGFVYVRESEDLMEAIREISAEVVEKCTEGTAINWTTIKTRIKNDVGGYLYSRTKRRPMILPIIMEV